MPLMKSGDMKAALDSPEKEALGSWHTASRGPLRDSAAGRWPHSGKTGHVSCEWNIVLGVVGVITSH